MIEKERDEKSEDTKNSGASIHKIIYFFSRINRMKLNTQMNKKH